MLQDVGGQVLRWFDPGVSSSGTVERGGNRRGCELGISGDGFRPGVPPEVFSEFYIAFAAGSLASSTAFPQGHLGTGATPSRGGKRLLPAPHCYADRGVISGGSRHRLRSVHRHAGRGTFPQLLEVERVRGNRPCYPVGTDAVTRSSCLCNTPPSSRSGSFNPGIGATIPDFR